jgi:hypothetical protein
MATGFSNERTSEYMILNDLYYKLKNKCSFFYPFYYHSKRDDTALSLLNDITDLHLIACFARRPKTYSPMSDDTYITFRQSMFEQTNILHKYSIPVISGTPIGTSIDKIGFGSTCIWFSIQPDIKDDYVICEFFKGIIEDDSLIKGINIIDDKKLYDTFESTLCYSWKEIIDLLRTWQIEFKDHFYMCRGLFNTIPVQKPVFIAYKF